MTHKDPLSRLASRLIARRDSLRTTLNGDLETFRTVSQVSGVGDRVDAAVDSANEEICSQLVEIESRELGQIEHALERMAAGVYGRCELCDHKIAATRLNALPYTNTCIHCQRQDERRAHSTAPDLDPNRLARIFENSIEEGENDARIDLGAFAWGFRESGQRSLDGLFV